MFLEWIEQANITLTEYPKDPNFNLIENLWTTLKSWIHPRNPTNLNKLYQLCQKDWSNNQPELCQRFTGGYQKHLVEVSVYAYIQASMYIFDSVWKIQNKFKL